MPFLDGTSASLVVESIQQYMSVGPALMMSLLDRECAGQTVLFSKVWENRFGGRTDIIDLDLQPLNDYNYNPQNDRNAARHLLLRDSLIYHYLRSRLNQRILMRWLFAKDHVRNLLHNNINAQYWSTQHLAPPGYPQSVGLREICVNWSWRIALHLELETSARTFWCWRANLLNMQLQNNVSIEERILFFEFVLGPILDQNVLPASQLAHEACAYMELDMMEYVLTSYMQNHNEDSIPVRGFDLIVYCLSCNRPLALSTVLECVRPWRSSIVQQSLELWAFETQANIPFHHRCEQPLLKVMANPDQQAKALILDFWSLNSDAVEIGRDMIDEWTEAQRHNSLSLLYSQQ